MFEQLGYTGVRIQVNVTGLAPNSKHGFHLMQFGDMLANGCYSQGSEFNPFNMTHGGPFSCDRMLGDSGNILADANGNAVADLDRPGVSLIGPFSFLGRGCVIREMADDFGLGG